MILVCGGSIFSRVCMCGSILYITFVLRIEIRSGLSMGLSHGQVKWQLKLYGTLFSVCKSIPLKLIEKVKVVTVKVQVKVYHSFSLCI